MLNPNLGGLQSKQLALGGLKGPQVLTPKPVGGEEPDAKPSAVWIGDGNCNGDSWGYNSAVRPGDVVFFDNGAHRLCVDPDGNKYWAKTTVHEDDFEADRGDIRRM